MPYLEKYGFGHSLEGNHITTLQLIPDDNGELRFIKVYAINDAAPTAYQMSVIDSTFRSRIRKQFLLKNDQDIYKIPPDELVAFTEEYDKNKIDESTIHHLTSEEDIIYGASSVRGFLEIGVHDGFC